MPLRDIGLNIRTSIFGCESSIARSSSLTRVNTSSWQQTLASPPHGHLLYGSTCRAGTYCKNLNASTQQAQFRGACSVKSPLFTNSSGQNEKFLTHSVLPIELILALPPRSTDRPKKFSRLPLFFQDNSEKNTRLPPFGRPSAPWLQAGDLFS